MNKIRKLTLPKKKVSFWVALFLTASAGMSVYYSLYQLYMPTKIIVPNKVIEAKTLISAKDLKEFEISKRDKHTLAVANPSQVVGKYSTVKLYPEEQIITERLTGDPGAITGAFSYLTPNETYVTLKSNEVRWPKGLKTGDTVTIMAIMEYGPERIVEKVKVIGTEEPSTILDPLKQTTGQTSSSSLTIAVDRAIVSVILDRKVKCKELHLLPDHPKYEITQPIGGENVESEIETTNQRDKRKRN